MNCCSTHRAHTKLGDDVANSHVHYYHLLNGEKFLEIFRFSLSFLQLSYGEEMRCDYDEATTRKKFDESICTIPQSVIIVVHMLIALHSASIYLSTREM